jgi:DNA helicase-2/ATP-dependent DNA helicase PcrA
MESFSEVYALLNAQQKQAVDTIDGPVLVVAGPGTGKTQLLTTRIANIIKKADVAPNNILCLTFTDNAARNMRERLETILGSAAYHVAIHTFHSFGGEVIGQYGDYFTKRQLLQQIDELGRYELLRGIFEELPHGNPLAVRVGDEFIHIKDTLQVISWLKQNALTPAELHQLITFNQTFMEAVSDKLADTFSTTPSPKLLPTYRKLLATFQKHVKDVNYFGFPEYARECAHELAEAIAATPSSGRYAPAITAWRNNWCQKDAAGHHVFKDGGRNLRKMHAIANVYDTLLARMSAQGLYDFDDMIVEVVHAMEQNDELRFSIQERYQYILVDEFQDTNKAQLRMLVALGNNPVYEGRPNIMAVGDDDQAIYAFQGAEVSNMVAFARLWHEPAIITLKDNYRSTETILSASFAVAEQITDRLETILAGTHKTLTAHHNDNAASVKHLQFPSELAQYDWLAEQIQQAITAGTQPEAIAVIAPRHRYLERLVPYLGTRQLPVAYERRENILGSPIIVQLLTMAKLITALHENRQDDVDQLLSEVLSYAFWGLNSADLIALSLDCYDHHTHWLQAAGAHPNPVIQDVTNWFVRLAGYGTTEPLEYMLDHLLGGLLDGFDSEFDDIALPTKTEAKDFISPMREFYFGRERYEQATDSYLTLLGQLSTLRQHLREWLPHKTLHIKDLVVFAELHEQANVGIIDTNPHTQTTNAVQVMTAYKAKGLEFEKVFVINAQDEVWGPTTRSRSSTISLPKNMPIAPASDGDNDKLRLLFVALTRAKNELVITGYTHTLDNKLSPTLSFIQDIEIFTPISVDKPTTTRAAEILSTDWAYRYRHIIADKPTLFEPILANYKLSVTHLNNFLDILNAGPEYFLVHNLLRFPEAPTPAAAYGDAVHKTLQWAHIELRTTGSLPKATQFTEYFSDMLARKHLRARDRQKLDQRGCIALEQFFRERGKNWSAKDIAERGFNNEGVIVGEARLSGKVDKLHFENDNTVRVIDYKTGKPASSWQGKDDFEKIKLHKYRQQLLFYKLLVEGSASYSGKLVVSRGALEFVEANEEGELTDDLALTFDPEELTRFTRLIQAVWQHIMTLNFPDTTGYARTMRGMETFEQDLIEGTI